MDAPNHPPPSNDRTEWCHCARLCGGGDWVTSAQYRYHERYRVRPEDVFDLRRAARGAPAAAGAGSAAPGRGRGVQVPFPRGALSSGASGRGGRQASPAFDQDEPSDPASPGRASPRRSASPARRSASPPRRSASPPRRPASPADLPDSRPPTPPPPRNDPDDEQRRAMDPEEGYGEDLGVPLEGHKEDVRVARSFIRGLQRARLDNTGLSGAARDSLRHPRHENPELTQLELAGLRMLLARGDASEDNYADHRATMMWLHPEDDIPTLEQSKRTVAQVTGIDALRTDMCINSCVAYTGPFKTLRECPECNESRYDPVRAARGQNVARRTFCTFPLGPQLQAMWGSPENARLMHHRATETRRILEVLRTQGPAVLPVIDDIYYANDYLKLVQPDPVHPDRPPTIQEDDMVLMFSVDGAQLYKNKSSDCWFYVWILFDLPPTSRYKKAYVLPGAVIGGPNKPKNIDSFLFPGLEHLAALQHEGLRVWDADRRREFTSFLYLYLQTADCPAMAYLNGCVGHHGACGCRVYCGHVGRHKPGKGTYYPANLRYHGERGDNPDVNLRERRDDRAGDIARYSANLAAVESAPRQGDYEKERLRTGIAKASIFSGLRRVQRGPRGFGLDLMHHISLNLTDLIVSTLRGTLACEGDDDRTTWDFAVYADPKGIWATHGAFIGSTTHCLPSSFNRPPRNPALKINSGYKAWEFLVYVYGYLPALLRTIMQPEYYRHFCKLVYAIRILIQYSIPRSQLAAAHQYLIEYVEDFERLYYRRSVDRLHFVRPSLHTLTHIVSETLNTGLCSLYTQWTLENYIGSITREIRQHVTPYANVSERALRRCQGNALQAMMPETFAQQERLPRRAIDISDGYVLLSPYEENPQPVGEDEGAAFRAFFARVDVVVADRRPSVRRWARLKLPTGQIARTTWKEGRLEEAHKQPRRARMIKLRGNLFAEVRYFFQMNIHGAPQTLALVSTFSPPDPNILNYSMHVLPVVQYRGHIPDSYRLVFVKDIVSVVAMLPLPLTAAEETHAIDFVHHRFVIEKPGLDVAILGGVAQVIEEEEDDI